MAPVQDYCDEPFSLHRLAKGFGQNLGVSTQNVSLLQYLCQCVVLLLVEAVCALFTLTRERNVLAVFNHDDHVTPNGNTIHFKGLTSKLAINMSDCTVVLGKKVAGGLFKCGLAKRGWLAGLLALRE